MEAYITLENVTLKFRLYSNRSPALKELVLGKLRQIGNTQDRVDEFVALNNISLTINGGDRVGIVGLNGAGKSTLLKAIVGIYTPQEGRIIVRGHVTPLIELGTGFDPDCSGRENIFLNGAMHGRSRAQMKEYESQIIEFAELREFIDQPIKYYSSGMVGRLAYAIGTMLEPEILLIDEVFSTGDARFVEKAMNRLTHLLDKSQVVVMVSHNMDQLKTICNRMLLIDRGVVVMDGAPDDVCSYYLEEVARAAKKSGSEIESLRADVQVLLQERAIRQRRITQLKEEIVRLGGTVPPHIPYVQAPPQATPTTTN